MFAAKPADRCNKWITERDRDGATHERCKKPAGQDGQCGGFTCGDVVDERGPLFVDAKKVQ